MATEEKKILLDIQLNYQVISKQIDDTTKKLGELKVEQFRLNEAMKQAQTQGNVAEYERLSAAVVKNNAEVKAYTQELRNLDKQAVLVAQAQKAEAGSYEETLRVLQLKRTQLKLMEDTMKRNADGTIELTAEYVKESAEVRKLAEAVIGFDQKIKDGRTNVGNYAAALEGLFASLGGLNSTMKGIESSLLQLNQDYKSGAITQDEFTNKSNELAQSMQNVQSEIALVSENIQRVEQESKSATDTITSFKGEVRAATDELFRIGKQFGTTSKEFEAQKVKVGELKASYKDLQASIDALDPDTKFKAFTQVLTGVAGGVSGVVGAMALFGDQSEATQQALLKVQAAMAFAQGIDQVMQLGDAWANVKSVLGITTAATTAQTAAQTISTEATAAGAVATEGLAAAEGTATVATAGLSTAINALLGPLGLILIGITAAVTAYKVLSEASAAQQKATERLIADAEKLQDRVKNAVDLGNELIKNQEDINARQLALLESEKTSDTDLFAQKVKNAQSLAAAQDAARQRNIENIREEEKTILAIQKERLATDDTELKKKLDAQEEAARKNIDILEKANNQIVADQKNANNQILIEQNNLNEKLRQTAIQAQTISLGLIKDGKSREIALENDALKQKLDAIKGNSIEELQLREALEAESADKIREIKRKYALETLQTNNELLVNSTIEGTDERFKAEEKAAIKLRDFLLRDESLTSEQRLKINQDTVIKIQNLEEQRITGVSERNRREIEIEQQTQETLLKLRQARSDQFDPNVQIGNSLDAINQQYIQEQIIRNENRNADLQSSETFYAKQLELLRFNLDFQSKSVEEKEAIVKGIIDKSRADQAAITASYDAQDQLALQNSVNATTDIIQQGYEKQLAAAREFNQLQLDATGDPQEKLALTLEQFDTEEQAQLAKNDREITNLDENEKRKGLIQQKYNNLRLTAQTAYDQSVLSSSANVLGQIAGLYQKGSDTYKAFASAQALINTYQAATAALAPPPTGAGPVFGPLLAAATIASGFANVAKINSIDSSIKAFADGGYSIGAALSRYSPTWVGSFSGGGRANGPQLGLVGEAGPELIVSNKTLSQDPAFFDQIEYWNRTGIRPFADGGYSLTMSPIMIPINVPTSSSTASQQQLSIDYDKLASVVVSAVKSVTIIADPVEMSTAQSNVAKVEARANI